jgi:NADPH-dependent glutamate synthase beta subunit-like oxidoreductase
MSEIDRILEECKGEELPPCVAACPLHVDAKGYVDLIVQGKVDEALALVYETVPFPGVLGRICMHPCETKCRRGDKDEPIAVCALKRFAADNGQLPGLDTLPEETGREKVAIVGAGPAGLMAAHDLRRMGYSIILFEALPCAGGMMRVGIPEWRLPRTVLAQEIGLVGQLGVEVRLNTKVGRDVGLEDLRRDFDAVFIAVGAHLSAKLGIPGEASVGVYQGIDFLRAVNLGEKVQVGKRVVVVGGGNVAIDAARAATRLGAESVALLYRRSRAEMPALESEVEEAEREGVEIQVLAAPVKVIEQGGRVVGLECIKMVLGEPDDSGRRRPVSVADSEFTVEGDMVIPAIGLNPDLSLISGKEADLVEGRLLKADPLTLETGIKGVFAGGDAVTGPAAVVDALAAGRKAAISIDRYLKGEDLSIGREEEGPQESQLAVDIEEVAAAGRRPMPTLPSEQRTSFEEVDLGYKEEAAKQEADRCLRCECRVCVRECEYLQTYCEAPRDLAARITEGALQETPELIFSCNLCSLCEVLCPQDLNVGKMCLDLRRQLVTEGVAPLAKHQPIIANQEFVSSESFALTLPDPGTGDAQRFFFPGCNLSGYSPDLVLKAYDYVRTNLLGTGIILSCCGGPVRGIGDQERLLRVNGGVVAEMEKYGASELIAACPHCYHIFKDFAPQIQVTSLYEVMAEQGLPETVKGSVEGILSLHDSCNTRHEVKVQDSVRQILEALGCHIQEPEFSREMTRCCGMGGMIAYTDFRLTNKVIMKRAKEMSHDVVSYCATCRDAFAMVGKGSRHLLDLIFNAEWEGAAKTPPKQGPMKQKAQTELRDRLIALGKST